MARRLGAVRDAPRHGRGRERGRCPLPRADQARVAPPATRSRGDPRGARPRSTSFSPGSRRPSSAPSFETSALDDYVLGEEQAQEGRRDVRRRAPRAVARAVHPAARRRPGALGLRHRPLPDLPPQVQVRARLLDPAGADDQPALRDPHPQRPGALPLRGDARAARAAPRTARGRAASTGCSTCWRPAGAGRASARRTTSFSTATARSRRSPATTSATCARPREPVWLERSFSFAIGDHHLRGRIDRVDKRPDGAYELIDYKTGESSAASKLSEDLQLALYRVAAREAWQLEATQGAYWYVLSDQRVEVEPAPDDAERVERTVLDVAGGIEAQDFEPRPSFEICSWCDYRLICPASGGVGRLFRLLVVVAALPQEALEVSGEGVAGGDLG